jgi:threonine dehydrogenase-like Zn-dependent dehydrogenase
MKAWITHDFNDMRLEEVPVPEPPRGWLLVKVEVCQPSVTDALRYRGVNTMGHQKIKKILENGPTQLFGHECCGEVVQVGEAVAGFKVGDRVASMGGAPCGECRQCMEGNPEFCDRPGRIGTDTPGWFAEYVIAPASGVMKIPAEMDPSEAACLQPFSSAITSVESANMRMGATVACLGQGVMGLYCSMVARFCGAGLIIGIDTRHESLQLASKLGVDLLIDSSKEDPVEAVLRATEGRGVDVVFECAGGSTKEGLAGQATMLQAMQIAGRCGKVVQVAHPLLDESLVLDPNPFKQKAVSYIFPRPVTARQFRYGIDLVARGRVSLRPLITHVLKGIEKVPEAFEITANKKKYQATNPAQVVIWSRQ